MVALMKPRARGSIKGRRRAGAPAVAPARSRLESAGIRVIATISDSITATENRHRDVAEQLPHLQLHHQDRGEHHNRRQRGHEDGAPHLARALEGGACDRASFLSQPEDVLEHDDGGIHHQADGERDSGQRNDVDGPSQGGHGDERPHHRDRDGQGY